MPRKLCISLGLVLGLFLCAPAASPAAATFGTTIGGVLGGSPASCQTALAGVPVTCTVFSYTVAEGGGVAPAGLFAPSDGVITRWRVGVDDFGPVTSMTAKPRVFGITGLNKLVALRTGTTQTIPAGGGQLTFEDRLKVSIGDRFGLDFTTVGAGVAGPFLITNTGVPSAKTLEWNPPLADGASFTLPLVGSVTHERFQINADIEADVDGDGFGDETQDLCTSRADIQAGCPPPIVTKPTFAKGVFSFTSDIAAKAQTTMFKVSSGRKVGKKCKAKATKGKKCKLYTKFAQWNDDVVPGVNKISYAYKVGGKSLKRGKYRATIVITSAQNTVTTKTVDFKVK